MVWEIVPHARYVLEGNNADLLFNYCKTGLQKSKRNVNSCRKNSFGKSEEKFGVTTPLNKSMYIVQF